LQGGRTRWNNEGDGDSIAITVQKVEMSMVLRSGDLGEWAGSMWAAFASLPRLRTVVIDYIDVVEEDDLLLEASEADRFFESIHLLTDLR